MSTHNDDDDRTVLVPASAAPRRASVHDNALPVGTRLAEFEVTGVLGIGGFGIVYLAHDRLLERNVALKEYMPAAFAMRDAQGHVSPRSERHTEAFDIGRRSFVNEGRLLAQFDAPSLLKVYRFWEENGTAYMVMPYYDGRTLKQALAESRIDLGEASLRRLLDALLDALELLHAQQCYHRDIAPDNIMMVDGDRPLLLDFGAARRAIGDMDTAFTTIFKQAYAPVEQISTFPDMRQGPWTDLFALAAVIHFAIDGQPPPPALGRLMNDPYVPLAQRHGERYGRQFLDAIDRALSVKPQDRPQSVAQMRALLGTAPAVQEAPPAPVSADGARRRPLLLGGALAVGVVAIAAAVYLGRGSPAPAASPAPQAAAPAPQPAPAQPGGPGAALDQLLAGASADRAVDVSVSRSRVVIDRDPFGFSVRSARAGYVYVYMLGSDQHNLWVTFPNATDRNNRIAAGQALALPRAGWHMEAGGPAGKDRFVAVVSDVPRDLHAAGMVDGQPFAEFPLAQLASRQQAGAGAAPLLLGNTDCPAQGACSPAYGAAAFVIEEVAPATP